MSERVVIIYLILRAAGSLTKIRKTMKGYEKNFGKTLLNFVNVATFLCISKMYKINRTHLLQYRGKGYFSKSVFIRWWTEVCLTEVWSLDIGLLSSWISHLYWCARKSRSHQESMWSCKVKQNSPHYPRVPGKLNERVKQIDCVMMSRPHHYTSRSKKPFSVSLCDFIVRF